VNLRVLVVLAVCVTLPRSGFATNCATVPPCTRVVAGSVMFVGTPIDSGTSADGEPTSLFEVHVSVQEIFEGLTPGIKEVIVTTEGSWLKVGEQYLFDAGRGADGRLYPTMCGLTGETTDEYTEDLLHYLRERARGKALTSLRVNVVDRFRPLAGARVTIAGPSAKLTSDTDSSGVANFSEFPPGTYNFTAAKEHYRIDKEVPLRNPVEIVAGACGNAMVGLEADSTVSGVVRDAKGNPVAALHLELAAVPPHPNNQSPVLPFETNTTADGSFLFESVSPGRYFLGSNIIGEGSSPLPPTFYPGRLARMEATPIDVKLGEATDNLILNLPDVGVDREFTFCVVDEHGKPVPSAEIGSETDSGEDNAGLGKNLTTDETGCVRAHGYGRATYEVMAILRAPSGADSLQTRDSEELTIPPGKGPVRKVLVLEPPLNPDSAKPR